jgi:hypothetical protein
VANVSLIGTSLIDFYLNYGGNLAGMCAAIHSRESRKAYQWRSIHWQRPGGFKVEASQDFSVTAERPVDWDRIGMMFVTFGIACSGIATLLYGLGFLIQALSHHA